MKMYLRFLGRLFAWFVAFCLAVVAMNNGDFFPFRYQASASVILIVAGVICLRRLNRDRHDLSRASKMRY